MRMVQKKLKKGEDKSQKLEEYLLFLHFTLMVVGLSLCLNVSVGSSVLFQSRNEMTQYEPQIFR